MDFCAEVFCLVKVEKMGATVLFQQEGEGSNNIGFCRQPCSAQFADGVQDATSSSRTDFCKQRTKMYKCH